MNEEKQRDKTKFMKAGFNGNDTEQEVKRKLEAKCMQCFSEFQQVNKGFIPFDYLKCKRCDTGRILHEMDTPGWFADFVKAE